MGCEGPSNEPDPGYGGIRRDTDRRAAAVRVGDARRVDGAATSVLPLRLRALGLRLPSPTCPRSTEPAVAPRPSASHSPRPGALDLPGPVAIRLGLRAVA